MMVLLLWSFLCWIFGFSGSHRFYYGRQLTGILWFFTGGLLGIGWLIELFLIPETVETVTLHLKKPLIVILIQAQVYLQHRQQRMRNNTHYVVHCFRLQAFYYSC